jgi:uncharacterized iron-regulated protein
MMRAESARFLRFASAGFNRCLRRGLLVRCRFSQVCGACLLVFFDIVGSAEVTTASSQGQAQAQPQALEKEKTSSPIREAVISKTPATHPLLGKIRDAKTDSWLMPEDVMRAASAADFVLLGETHDNAEHHRLQLAMVESIAQTKRRPALAMEQFDRENQAAIDLAFRALIKPDSSPMQRVWLGESADALADAGTLNRTAWQWPQYRPLVEAAVQPNLPLAAANLSRVDARNVYAKGLPALSSRTGSPPADEAMFASTWSSQREAAVRKAMVESHCGQLPDALAPGMVNAQRARDMTMASALVTHADRGGILIAGRGHVRRDFGVPIYLAHWLPKASILSIGFVEVLEDRTTPSQYEELTSEIAKPFDIVWFTAKQERSDPCEGMTLKKFPSAK